MTQCHDVSLHPIRRQARFFGAVWLAAVAVLWLFASATPAGAQVTAVHNVELFDGTGAPRLSGATVLIEGGRITAVGSAAEVVIPAGAEVVDGGGGTLVPGFVDAHAHLTMGPVAVEVVDGEPTVVLRELPGGAEHTLLLLLAHGVTTVRDPGGRTEEAIAVREALARGELTGPRAVVAGRVIDTTRFQGLVDQATSAEEVRAAVRRQAEAGVDLVKLYTGLGRELLAAGIDEAHRHGLPAVAHLHDVPWAEAAALGLDGILHVIPGSATLLPEASRQAYAAKLGAAAFPAWFHHVDFDAPAIRETIRALAHTGTHLDLTLVVFEHAFFGDLHRFRDGAPGVELAHPELLANWQGGFHFNLGWTEEDFTVAHRAWPKVLSFARRLWEGGVTLAAGTDANNPFTVPGVSFHRELELLAAAGIPNAAVLEIATRNGAEVAGLLAETGTIVPGKRADLVLLDGDPLVDIAATRRIVWVMKDGVRHDPAELLAAIRGGTR